MYCKQQVAKSIFASSLIKKAWLVTTAAQKSGVIPVYLDFGTISCVLC